MGVMGHIKVLMILVSLTVIFLLRESRDTCSYLLSSYIDFLSYREMYSCPHKGLSRDYISLALMELSCVYLAYVSC